MALSPDLHHTLQGHSLDFVTANTCNIAVLTFAPAIKQQKPLPVSQSQIPPSGFPKKAVTDFSMFSAVSKKIRSGRNIGLSA
ncbi:Sentrin-Specific Protease 2 [Manis pentadactyla]|nr:Sentrin-Specific Protease 2 [Manis pentadactyla]